MREGGPPQRAIRWFLAPATAAVVLVVTAGCNIVDSGSNEVNGKQLFVQKCGSCHVLSRAGTKGVTGPNLDEAFQQAVKDGLERSTFEGIVQQQILYPNSSAQIDPKTGKPAGLMPAKLVTGEDAEDVAAYVAGAVAARGKDTGALAQVGAAKAEGTARAQNGELEIPADPGGSLIYRFANATAPAGSLTIRSPNESSVPHNIALEGSGVDEVGEIVQNGGVSEIEAEVQSGEYTFFCSVQGHREAGMEGKLTVE